MTTWENGVFQIDSMELSLLCINVVQLSTGNYLLAQDYIIQES